jgi:hypothetical protein
MVEYQRSVGPGSKVSLAGKKCDRCGYVQLDSDEDVWAAVGL